MKSLQMASVAIGACFIVLSSSVAFANPNPAGTGQPSQTCQNFVVSGTTLSTPGKSANSPGSVFNEPLFGSLNGGTGGTSYNNAGAPSQYDVACFQQSVKGPSRQVP